MEFDLITNIIGNRDMQQIKLVIWDLDNVIWDGVLLEDKSVTLRPNISAIIQGLDKRGTLRKNSKQI